MTRTQRQRFVMASCAVGAFLVIGIAIVVWRMPGRVKQAQLSDERADLLMLRRLQEGLATDLDLESLVAELTGGVKRIDDLDAFRTTLRERVDTYMKSRDLGLSEKLRDLVRDEEFRAYIRKRVKDQPVKLQSVQELRVP